MFGTYLVDYVFGNVIFASLFLLYLLFLLGVRHGWSLDTFVVILTPTFFLLSDGFLPIDFQPIVLFVIGLLIGFGLLAVVRR